MIRITGKHVAIITVSIFTALVMTYSLLLIYLALELVGKDIPFIWTRRVKIDEYKFALEYGGCIPCLLSQGSIVGALTGFALYRVKDRKRKYYFYLPAIIVALILIGAYTAAASVFCHLCANDWCASPKAGGMKFCNGYTFTCECYPPERN